MTNDDLTKILDRQIKKLIPDAETWLDFGNYETAEKVLGCLKLVLECHEKVKYK